MYFVLSRVERAVLVKNKILLLLWLGKKYAVGLGQNGQFARDIHIFLTHVFGENYRKPGFLKETVHPNMSK